MLSRNYLYYNIICFLFLFKTPDLFGQYYNKGLSFKEYINAWKSIEQNNRYQNKEENKNSKINRLTQIGKCFPLYYVWLGKAYLEYGDIDSAYFYYKKSILEGNLNIQNLDSTKIRPVWDSITTNIHKLKKIQAATFYRDSDLIKKISQLTLDDKSNYPQKALKKEVRNNKKERSLDSLNIFRLKKIILEKGWPSTKQVGDYSIILGLSFVLRRTNEVEAYEMYDLLKKEIPNATDLWYPYHELVTHITNNFYKEGYMVFRYLTYDKDGKVNMDDDTTLLQLYGITKLLQDNKNKFYYELVAFNNPKTDLFYEESLARIHAFMTKNFDVKENIILNKTLQNITQNTHKQYSFGVRLIWF